MKRTALALLAASMLARPALGAPAVVVSIKPVHSLVAAIMKDVAEPGLVLKGAGSPHTYQMKPADAELLQEADIVFWIGPDLEKFLEKPLESLGDKARRVELEDAPGLTLLRPRESGTFEHHDHGDGEHSAKAEAGHEDEERDAHVWLNTGNAKVLARTIADTLAEADPVNAGRYRANLTALDTKLDALSTELKATLEPVKDKPFVVFHDAYQYFEAEYGVNVAGSITVSPEHLPGAARISEIHDKLKSLAASCVFAEPQFEPKLVNVVIEGTTAKTGTLDPEGATLDAGPDLYFDLMRSIAGSIRKCLG
jgi:zinc transport system substrate-binding protein